MDDNVARAAALGSPPSEHSEGDFASSPFEDRSSTPLGSPGGSPEQDATSEGGVGAGEGAEWQAFQDDEGRTYYYNEGTGESSWDVPAGFDEGEGENSERVEESADNEKSAGIAPSPSSPVDEGGGTPPPSSPMGEFGETPSPSSPMDEGGETPPPSSPVGDGGGTPLPSSPVGEGGGTPPPSSPVGEGGGSPPPSSPVGEGGGTPPPSSPVGEGGGTPPPSSPRDSMGQEEITEVGRWAAYTDDEGREYYYNEDTGETQWDKPEGAKVLAADEEAGGNETVEDFGEEAVAKDEPQISTAEPMEVEMLEEPVPKEPERDPEEVALENAEKALREVDGILETSCLANVGEVVRLGGETGGQKAMQSLIGGYHGQTAICGLLSLWLAELRAANASSSKPASVGGRAGGIGKSSGKGGDGASGRLVVSRLNPQEEAANGVRAIAEDVIHRLAKERFTVTGGDEMLNLSKAEVSFLEDMIESDQWRRLLIDLSAKHKDSALLMYCLQKISKRGHHREIARRINQSDYFGVFNSMLSSELSFLGEMAVGGDSAFGENADAKSMGVKAIVDDLRRTCTSTSYTYIYAMEVLEELSTRARAKKISDPSRAAGVKRALRKWGRLMEELEGAMLDGAAASNALMRKRRADIALTVGELYQRKRRRVAPPTPAEGNIEQISRSGGNGISLESVHDALDASVFEVLKKHSLGMSMDARLADQLLRGSYGNDLTDRNRIGETLIKHPAAVSALLGCLFRPGSSRVRQLELRHKCAKLVALAVSAGERAVESSSPQNPSERSSGNIRSPDDEERLTKVLLKASQLCESVENMVTFTVVDTIESDDGASSSMSVGRQLSSQCIQHASVAQGVLLWATELGNGLDFANSAAYPTLAPSLLSLVRIISTHHPFARPATLDLAFVFLKHSSPDLMYQKISALKEQGIRLLLWLMVHGQAVDIFNVLTPKLRKGVGAGGSGMDSANLRYFVSGALDIMQPPLSIPLVRSMGTFLATKSCVDVLLSSHFDMGKKKKLRKLLGHFQTTVEVGRKGDRAGVDDTALVSSLQSVYV